jgi:hypothetical protein
MMDGDWLVCSDLSLMIDQLRGKMSSRKAMLFACGCCRSVWDLLIDDRSRAAVEHRELHVDGMVSKSELQRVWRAANEGRSSVAAKYEEQGQALKQTIREVLFPVSKAHSTTPGAPNQISEDAWLDWACVLCHLDPEKRLLWLRELESKFITEGDVLEVLSLLEALRVNLESDTHVRVKNAVEAHRRAGSWCFAATAASRLAWEPPSEEEDIYLVKSVANYALDAASLAPRLARGKGERDTQCSLLREVVGDPFRQSRGNCSWVNANIGTVFRVAQSLYENRFFEEMVRFADLLEKAGCDSQDILQHCRIGGPHIRGCWVLDLILGKP